MTKQTTYIRKGILILGVVLSTYGGMTQNNTILLIGGVISVVGTIMIAVLK